MSARVKKKRPLSPSAFKKGNKVGVGNPGPSRPSFLTQTLISQLNEIDRHTGKEKMHSIAERLIQLAMGGRYKIGRKWYNFPGELSAIKEVFDRVQGRPVQSVGFDTDNGQVTLTFGKKDANA